MREGHHPHARDIKQILKVVALRTGDGEEGQPIAIGFMCKKSVSDQHEEQSPGESSSVLYLWSKVE